MTSFRAFLREDKSFLGLYSWGWVILAGVIGFALVLIFGPPAWLAAVIWRLFEALVAGASITAGLMVVVALLIFSGVGFKQMNIKDEQQMAEHFGQPGPMDRIRQKRKGERAYTNDEIARFENLRAELRAFDDPAQIDRLEKAVAVLRGNAK